MKFTLAFTLFSLLLLGCIQTISEPSPAVTATPTQSLKPAPIPVAAEVIQQAQKAVPLSGSFLVELTGTEPKEIGQYSMTSEGSFSLSLNLRPLTQLDFHGEDFIESLKHVATASSFRKTVSVDSTQFAVKWSALDAQGNAEEAVEVKLVKKGASSVCVIQKNGEKECVTPSKDQVEQLWSALQSNALEEGIKTFYPGVSLKELLKVEKAESTASYAGRPCTSYALSLTQTGLDELNKLGGSALADLKGSLCLDSEYGFPLYVELKSALAKATEEVKEFKTQTKETPTQTCKFMLEGPLAVGVNPRDLVNRCEPPLSFEGTKEFILPEDAQILGGGVYYVVNDGCARVLVNGQVVAEEKCGGDKKCYCTSDCAPPGGLICRSHSSLDPEAYRAEKDVDIAKLVKPGRNSISGSYVDSCVGGKAGDPAGGLNIKFTIRYKARACTAKSVV